MPECVYCGGKFDAIAMGGSNMGVHDWLACCRRKADLVPEMLSALKGVVAVADRKTIEFDAARAAIAKEREMSLNQALPAETIKTRDAAEAIYWLFEMFDMSTSQESLENWIGELETKWPDLAAMLSTVSHDE